MSLSLVVFRVGHGYTNTKGSPQMNQPDKWRGPRPDPAVIQLIDKLRSAALQGHIRTLVVVTVNPLLEVETLQAGEVDNVRKHLLLGGLASACIKYQQASD